MGKYNQTATYWEPGALDEYAQQSFSSPVQIDVRWENKTIIHIDRATGKERQSRSIVYTDNELKENGFLFLGDSTDADPRPLKYAFLINRVDVSTCISGRKKITKAWA